MSEAKKARKYWENNLRKYRQHVINGKKLHKRIVDVDKSDYSRACAWMEIIVKDPCAYCGKEATDIDHIEPLHKLGMKGNLWDNLISSCRRCNGQKYSHSLLHFLLMRR